VARKAGIYVATRQILQGRKQGKQKMDFVTGRGFVFRNMRVYINGKKFHSSQDFTVIINANLYNFILIWNS
jgi:hypothetical protein